MPCSPTRARKLLRDGKAEPVRRTPFVIRLKAATGETRQPITLGVDAGSKHVGLSATTAKEELFASEVELRQDTTDLLSGRSELRRGLRSRKMRYREPRFDNRVHGKNAGWLAPSVENRINAHISRIEDVMSFLPITSITVETAAFDIQKIKHPEIAGEAYRQGEQLGFRNVREYVLFRNGHVCQAYRGKSNDPILNVHHIESRKTGGDAPNNLITLCETCHKAYHAGKLKKFTPKRGQSFKAEAFMGIMRWTVLNRLRERHPELPISNTYGYLTKHKRIVAGLPKTHCSDAFCIAGNLNAKRRGEYLYQKQTRKHNRQTHKLTILKGGVRKRQQAPYLVKGFRLFDKVLCSSEVGFVFGRRSSGYFDIRTLSGRKISAGIFYKKLRLIEKRKTYLTEYRKEEAAIPPSPEGEGFLAASL